jgi:vancomycin resistance protein YoaR
LAAAVLAVVLVLIVVVWSLDEHARTGRVARDVRLVGHDVGGFDQRALAAELSEISRELQQARLSVVAPGGGFQVTGGEIRLGLDAEKTARATMRVGRSGSPIRRVARWVLSAVRPTHAPVHVNVDVASVYDVVNARDPGPRVPATEPSFRPRGAGLAVVAGAPGRGIDAREIVEALPSAVARGVPLVTKVGRGSVAPRHTQAEAEKLIPQAAKLSARPIEATVASRTATVPVETLRSWMTVDPRSATLRVALDREKVMRSLRAAFGDLGKKPTDARFSVSGGKVVILPSSAGTECCSDRAADQIERAMLSGRTFIGALSLAVVDPEFTTAEARAMGVREAIGSFTTRHPAGAPRVQNIHRIAELVRGTIIPAGETFSLNKTAGPRTVERGFVDAPVIAEGRFGTGVGGGVSQFATTLFNAAFFGGLDLVQYQSHSIYIDRYPYGRESTVSDPQPDVRLRNPSKTAVLIWATFDSTSITVTLYSTKFAVSEQTAQVQEPRGPCTFVRTTRTRRFLADDSVKVDHVNALYRPEEGVECPR